MNRMILSEFIESRFITPKDQSFKFGYYNYSPISNDSSKLLAHKIYFEGRMPNSEDKVDIGYFEIDTGKWNKLTESNAFNWQQGSMLQWLGPEFNNSIIYNDVVEDKYVARIINLETEEKKTLPKAIYGVDPEGKFSISLNFERCYFTRAYSYAPIIDKRWNGRIPENDGIIKINLETGNYDTIITIADFLASQQIEDDGETMHWFEHIMLNPSGTRFAFYHRYGSIDSFSTRLYTADVNGKNIWKHPFKQGDRFSHLGWRDDNNYVVTTFPETRVANAWKKKAGKKKKTPSYIKLYRILVKPFMPKKFVKAAMQSNKYYALTKDKSGIIGKILPQELNQDGHPSFTKNGKFMLTDTYADHEGYRHLLLCDCINNNLIELGKFYSHFNNCGWRADLHPRFSPDEKNIIIDSAHNKHHQIIVLTIDWQSITDYKY